MSKQPTALYLAQILQTDGNSVSDAAAEELRRLYAANLDCVAWFNSLKAERDELLNALHKLASWDDGEVGRHMDEPYAAAISRAAIAKAETL